MSAGGEAAEQVVRLSLDGVSVVAKITGNLARELAVMLLAALKDRNQNKVKGRYRFLGSMLRHNKQIEIVSIKQTDLKAFVQGAKRYGIVYCVLRKNKDNLGECEIMVRPEDVSKVNRIVENIKVATVDLSQERQLECLEAEQPELHTDEQLLDAMLAPEEVENPSPAPTEKGPPSAPSSMSSSNIAGASDERPSVRQALMKIRQEQQVAREGRETSKEHKNRNSKIRDTKKTGPRQPKAPKAPKKGGAR